MRSAPYTPATSAPGTPSTPPSSVPPWLRPPLASILPFHSSPQTPVPHDAHIGYTVLCLANVHLPLSLPHIPGLPTSLLSLAHVLASLPYPRRAPPILSDQSSPNPRLRFLPAPLLPPSPHRSSADRSYPLAPPSAHPIAAAADSFSHALQNAPPVTRLLVPVAPHSLTPLVLARS